MYVYVCIYKNKLKTKSRSLMDRRLRRNVVSSGDGDGGGKPIKTGELEVKLEKPTKTTKQEEKLETKKKPSGETTISKPMSTKSEQKQQQQQEPQQSSAFSSFFFSMLPKDILGVPVDEIKKDLIDGRSQIKSL